LSLLIVKEHSPEDRSSPEIQFAFRLVSHFARRVFDKVTIQYNRYASTNDDYVLWISTKTVLITEGSLQVMKTALDKGADVAIPANITQYPLDEELHTLNDYQRAEAEILSKRHRKWTLPNTLTIAMFKLEIFEQLTQIQLTQLQDLERYHVEQSGIYYGFIDYYGVIHEDILQFIPQDVSHILEIGCARGATGKHIKEQYTCHITGVELNPIIAKDAEQNLDEVIVGDVIALQLEPQEKYDVIIATELFEHLPYPDAFLVKLSQLIKPNGLVILSTPNVGHYSVVEDLIAGRWDYIPMGLLCYTHVRFFTRHTLEMWCEMSPFRTYEIIPKKTDLPKRFRRLHKNMTTDYESLSTSGFYVILRP